MFRDSKYTMDCIPIKEIKIPQIKFRILFAWNFLWVGWDFNGHNFDL